METRKRKKEENNKNKLFQHLLYCCCCSGGPIFAFKEPIIRLYYVYAILCVRYTYYSKHGIHMHMNKMKQNFIYTIFRHIVYIRAENGEEKKTTNHSALAREMLLFVEAADKLFN